MRCRAALPLLCLALLALLARPAAAGGHAVAVDDANFDALVLASADAWVLEFASPRCGTCQELAPLYAQLAAKNNAVARFGAVDIDTPGGMALAQRLQILEEGVPNVRAYVRAGDAAGARVFSGWQVPPAAELEAALLAALRQAVPQVWRARRRAACAERCFARKAPSDATAGAAAGRGRGARALAQGCGALKRRASVQRGALAACGCSLACAPA
jgi:thiol-disulfide isomerase/thioredoxin